MLLHEGIVELLYIIVPAIVMGWLHGNPLRKGGA